MASQKEVFKLYSTTAPVEIRRVVLALKDGGHDNFRSGRWGDSATLPQSWLEAAKNPITKQWAVVRHEETGEFSASTPVMTEVCFFDALHACGAFEMEKQNSGLLPFAPDEEDADIPHYSDVAEKADIPLDRDGVPHPAMNGVTLTEAFLDKKNKAVAARTRGKALEEPSAMPEATGKSVSSLETLKVFSPPEDSGSTPQILSLEERRKAYQRAESLKNVLKTSEFMTHIVRLAIKKDYGEIGGDIGAGFVGVGLGLAVPALATIPLLGPFGLMLGLVGGLAGGLMGSKIIDSRRENGSFVQFDKAYKGYQAAVEKIPESEASLKSLSVQFGEAAKSCFALGYIAHLNQQYIAKIKSEKDLKKCQKVILGALEKYASELNWKEEEFLQLKQKFERGVFPQPSVFAQEIHNQHVNTIDRALRAQIKNLEPEFK